jgi:FAD/FMN-containing dehydrogenase
MSSITSWGRITAEVPQVMTPDAAAPFALPTSPYLPVGLSRSYGDTALPDGVAISTAGLDRILSFDPATGQLVAEAGVSLAAILDHVMSSGWFLPVLPGTRFVTLGGAIANDIHGKNHHAAGSFGAHCLSFELLRSDGRHLSCSASENAGLFAATIGGMGLTGLITRAQIQLIRVASAWVRQDRIRFDTLRDFFTLAHESQNHFAYTVAWIDALASGASLGRGVFLRGDHAPGGKPIHVLDPKQIPFPVDPPFALINRLTLSGFNAAYRNLPWRRHTTGLVRPESFFFPLDKVANWNRAYGPKGLRQFQCVVPLQEAYGSIGAMLLSAQKAGHGSFLTVLKLFGARRSPGILSFPRPGATLTLDFPYQGAKTDELLETLDQITLASGGAVNPCKDARMSRAIFETSFPEWSQMLPYLDSNARSVFSNRIGLTGPAPTSQVVA